MIFDCYSIKVLYEYILPGDFFICKNNDCCVIISVQPEGDSVRVVYAEFESSTNHILIHSCIRSKREEFNYEDEIFL